MMTHAKRIGLVMMFGLVLAMAVGPVGGLAYAAAGDLDPSFDGDGRATTNFHDTLDEARAVAVQPDGKIVAVGTTYVSGHIYDFALVRYNPDGSLDNTFTGDGKTTLNLFADDEAYAVTIQPGDGKIVVVGSSCGWAPGPCHFVGARFNPDGYLDTGFGGDGKVWLDFIFESSSGGAAVAIQPDGKIVVAGYTNRGPSGGGRTNFALARLNTDGSLDNTFDGDGWLTTDFFGNDDEVRAVAIQPDGKIVVAGSAQVSGSDYDFALARYNSNGSLDTSFDGDGKVVTDFFGGGDNGAYALALQPDGKIVAAGHSWNVTGGYDFGFARYLSNGELDTTFDLDGKQVVGFAAGVNEEVARGIALQSDGKIVAAGYAPVDGTNDFALTRLNPDGSLDYEFGGGDGRVSHDFGGGVAVANGVVIQADGRIVVAGTAYMGEPHSYDFALARYLSGAEPPPTATPQATATACPIQFSDVPPGHTFYTYVMCLACRQIVSGYPDGTFGPNNPVTRGQLSKIVSNSAGYTEPHTDQSFEDVEVGSTFHLFVERLFVRGYISGYQCGGVGEPCVPPTNRPYFRPNSPVTRGQTSKIVASAAGLPAPPPGLQTFEDVPNTHTFWEWIEELASSAAITGYPCGGVGEPCVPPENRYYFRPANNVTRGQSAKILAYTFFPVCQSR